MKLWLKRYGRVGSGAILTAFLFSLLVAAQTLAKDEIKIGTVMPLSGPLSILGMTWGRGFDLAADAINDQGGVKIGDRQYQLKIIQEDSKGNAEAARAATLKLAHRDKAQFVLGGILEPAIEAINEVAQKAEIFYGATSANIPGHPADVAPTKKFQARLFPSYDDAHAADLDYLKKAYPEAKTIAISAPDIGYEPMIDHFKSKAEARGFEVVFVEKWQWGTVDFLPVFTKILAAKPDVVLAMVSGQAQYQLMAARQLGFKGPFYSNSPLAPEVFLNVAGAEVCTDLIVNAVNTQKSNAPIEKVMALWAKAYKEPFVSDSLLAYDAVWILVQAMEKAQSLEPQQVMAALEGMTALGDVQTLHGPGKMGGMERFGVNRVLVRPVAISHMDKSEVVYAGFIQPE